MTGVDPIAVTLQVVDVLESLHVAYLIGGSLASATHGVVRATRDADLVVDLKPTHVHSFVELVHPYFYIHVNDIYAAIQQKSSFNVIHLETFFKIDLFIAKDRPFDHVQLTRRIAQVVVDDPERRAYFASAEDTILTKLEWYRMGGDVSDRQWNDVIGVLKVQQLALDETYLRQWAEALSVIDLLERAWQEALS